ncbi:hypothetical protein HPP92_001302 [Vanilla planifolia]|uniref:Rab-GAP TBC domain-containing protein n=1 Tax=Vanilla planifolia TaxID=51239 RepID=A0A835RZ16_VANPL|nr:hypothetical protein HPP92_001302 [Vanilla planifolia]
MVWGWVDGLLSGISRSIGKVFPVRGGGDGWIRRIGGEVGGDRWHVGVAVGVTAMAGIAMAATLVMSSRRGSLKSPWSRRKRKHVLTPQQWKRLFTPEGKFFDGGARFLKKVRSGGVDRSIRCEVWPFLLGVFDLTSSEVERNLLRKQHWKEYKKLRKRCQVLLRYCNDGDKMLKEIDAVSHLNSPSFSVGHDSPSSEVLESGKQEKNLCVNPDGEIFANHNSTHSSITESCKASASDGEREIERVSAEEKSNIGMINIDSPECESESSDSECSTKENGSTSMATTALESIELDSPPAGASPLKGNASKSARTAEDFTTWQRIIRLDAVRANAEWVVYAPEQAVVSDDKARELAESVGLKDYDHLEPCMIYHASRLVAVLEAYAMRDPEIGYCQGMSDLLSPILSVMEEDADAFWCFVGFMKKARHNFRLDEFGIRRQLGIVSKIIKFKDPHLYRHLEKLQAEDCFFVYRMVVVLFRRELNFEQTLCLWEVMWADQAAIRAGFGKSAWARIRMRAPPTDDLLLYAIAACVLQRRKLIIERYNSMDEILRECNNMAGHLDVWKLLDDAHDLVVTLHEKIS